MTLSITGYTSGSRLVAHSPEQEGHSLNLKGTSSSASYTSGSGLAPSTHEEELLRRLPQLPPAVF